MMSIWSYCSQMLYYNIYMHVCAHTTICHFISLIIWLFFYYFSYSYNCSLYSAPDLVNDFASPVEMLTTAHTQLKLKGVLFDRETQGQQVLVATGFLQNTRDLDWWSCQDLCVWSENTARHFLPCCAGRSQMGDWKKQKQNQKDKKRAHILFTSTLSVQ